ncbi:MAG TPA: DAK2 domain-containing protein [Anaerolineaceae bacterium]|nr:DAK2 domain-containing protein [Anaerolineaceae bacterium]
MSKKPELLAALEKISLGVEKNLDYLGELDGKSGDGDLGLSMKAAFDAINQAAAAYPGDDLGLLFLNAAMDCNRAAPSTMGTLLSAGLMAVAKAYKGQEELSEAEIIRLPHLFAEGIQSRGKAKLGDKTILDALLPYADALESYFAETQNLKEASTKAAEVAERAAEATKGMQAQIGRAKWLGERASAYADGGATLWAIIARSLTD